MLQLCVKEKEHKENWTAQFTCRWNTIWFFLLWCRGWVRGTHPFKLIPITWRDSVRNSVVQSRENYKKSSKVMNVLSIFLSQMSKLHYCNLLEWLVFSCIPSFYFVFFLSGNPHLLCSFTTTHLSFVINWQLSRIERNGSNKRYICSVALVFKNHISQTRMSCFGHLLQ